MNGGCPCTPPTLELEHSWYLAATIVVNNDTGMTELDHVSRLLRRAGRITALTGAGVSAGSGIPTFRGADGLWKKVRAETLATPEAFASDPRLVWEWYDWRRQMIVMAQPNPAHEVLARWSRDRPGFTLITQNVDGLHERAGTAGLIRLHGSIWHLRCWTGCAAGRHEWFDEVAPLPKLPPACRHCGGIARPAVVWFGEPLDPAVFASATAACGCDVFLAIGTSAVVSPAAGLIHYAKRHRAFTVEINPGATDASSAVDVSIRGTAEDVLTAMASALDR
jgi:NAD-dependent deacetylase